MVKYETVRDYRGEANIRIKRCDACGEESISYKPYERGLALYGHKGKEICAKCLFKEWLREATPDEIISALDDVDIISDYADTFAEERGIEC